MCFEEIIFPKQTSCARMGSHKITYIGMGGLVVCADVWMCVCIYVWGAPWSVKVR